MKNESSPLRSDARATRSQRIKLPRHAYNPGVTPVRPHKRPCKHCPSAHFPPDPEVQDILKLPLMERKATMFPCGWAPSRLCKGYFDLMTAESA